MTSELIGLADIERELASQPRFAQPEAIQRKVVDLCRFIGEVVGLPPGVDRAGLLDPMTRIALTGALHAYRSDEPAPRATIVVFAALRAAPTGPGPLVANAAPSLGRRGVPYWSVRRTTAVGEAFGAFFAAQLAESGLAGAAALAEPDLVAVATLASAFALLHDTVPLLAASALAHCRLLAHVAPTDRANDGLFESASFDEVPGVLFLSPLALGTVEQAAEAILHEALHQKLTDLRLTASLLRPGYDHRTARTIAAPWTRTRSWNSARWDTDRALAACHVYVHLAVLHLRLDPTSRRAAVALERATYLADELHRQAKDPAGGGQPGPAEGDLQRDGHDLVRWLRNQAHALAEVARPMSLPATR